MKRLIILAGLIILLFLVLIWIRGTSLSLAGIPKLINYQGMLTDNSGNPLTGTFNITFKIYNASSGGDSIWGETQYGVSVDTGLFNVNLGDSTPINLDFSEDYWLDITVETEHMPDRLRFTSVGYAYRAKVAASAAVAGSGGGGGGGWVDDGSAVRLETSTDKVGIGTTWPGAKLQVGDGSSDDFIRVMGSTSAVSAEIGAHMDGFGYLKINDDGGTTTALIDPDDGVSYIRYGNVGIGTTTPTERLTVAGTIESTSGGIKFPDGTIQTAASAPTWHQILPAAERFKLVMGGAAVLDKETGLVWEWSPSTTTRTWASAIFYCYPKNVGNRKGWRLPTVEELASLVDPTQSNPALPSGHPFSNVQSSYYWSATTFASSTTSAWTLSFGSGNLNGAVKTTAHYVWCVRGGHGYDAY